MLIDGTTTDLATFGVAFFYAFVRAARDSFNFTLEKAISDLSYGLSLYPMLLLSMVAFSSRAMQELQQSNKVLMSMAGIMSLVVILRRSFERSPHESRWGR